MLFGSHVSVAGGLPNAPLNATSVGAECFQFFSRSPRGGKPPAITPVVVKEFKNNCVRVHISEYFIHTPYYINLASSKQSVYRGSISIIREELARGSLLGAKYVMTHLGSGKDLGREAAMRKVVQGLKEVLSEANKYSTKLLLENSAGAGLIIGDTFSELGKIISDLSHPEVGVCLDTAHAYASGYDIKAAGGLDKTLKEFEEQIGLQRLQLIHGNDSMVALGERKDRHAKIGEGKLGREFFANFVNHSDLKDLCFVLETPKDTPADDIKAINFLKQSRRS